MTTHSKIITQILITLMESPVFMSYAVSGLAAVNCLAIIAVLGVMWICCTNRSVIVDVTIVLRQKNCAFVVSE